MSLLRRADEVVRWCEGAYAAYGDPSAPICQLCVRWADDFYVGRVSGDLVCSIVDGQLLLSLGESWRPLPIPWVLGEPVIDDGPELQSYGLVRLGAGVWVMNPSLNLEGELHGFVTLYDVPEPAPFGGQAERPRILLPAGVGA